MSVKNIKQWNRATLLGCVGVPIAGIGLVFLLAYPVWKDKSRVKSDIPDSIKLCGTFEAPGSTPGSIVAEDFQMVITKDGAMIDPGPDPGPEDRVKLRICEEGE